MAQHKASSTFHEFKLKSSEILDKVRDIIEEGNARRIIIKKGDRVLMEFPLSVGVGGTTAALLFTPHLAAIGAVVALVSDVRLVVERDAEPPTAELTTAEPGAGDASDASA
ncbi:hypothetical protein AWN76_007440 [Rhodothermaceae bacterium RA]|nr:hypothetical protein AWN76_007440 [Rhodothermaceae bacterium RA]